MGVQHVYKVSDPTSRELCARGEACLYWFRTYLQAQKKYTHTCIIASNSRGLFARVQPVYIVSFSYLQGTVHCDTAYFYGF